MPDILDFIGGGKVGTVYEMIDSDPSILNKKPPGMRYPLNYALVKWCEHCIAETQDINKVYSAAQIFMRILKKTSKQATEDAIKDAIDDDGYKPLVKAGCANVLALGVKHKYIDFDKSKGEKEELMYLALKAGFHKLKNAIKTGATEDWQAAIEEQTERYKKMLQVIIEAKAAAAIIKSREEGMGMARKERLERYKAKAAATTKNDVPSNLVWQAERKERMERYKNMGKTIKAEASVATTKSDTPSSLVELNFFSGNTAVNLNPQSSSGNDFTPSL